MPERCVREKELGGVLSLRGRGVRGVWVQKRCVRGKASFCLFPSLRCTVGAREEALLEFRGPPLLGVGWCVREVRERSLAVVRERSLVARGVREK